jgi:hypothetical protein
MSNLGNFLNPKLMELLAGVDKTKLDQVGKMVNNMSPQDLSNLIGMLGGNTNRSAQNNEDNNSK